MKICWKVGMRFIATIKTIHDEGVYIDMPTRRGAGVIPSSYWGDGATRKAVLASIHPGDRIPVVVKKYIVQSATLSLVPDMTSPKLKPRKSTDIHRKSSYKLVAQGTTFLVDVANLLGRVGPEHAAYRLRVVNDSLVHLGYKVLFFLEHRTYSWLWHNQDSDMRKDALRQFVKMGGVSLVKDEADLAILQCVRQIPYSVCVTNDKFKDYQNVYGDIVGTSRVRSFSWAKVDDHLFLTIDGLVDAITIHTEEKSDMLPNDSGSRDSSVASDNGMPREARGLRPAAPSGNDAVLELGRFLLSKGDAKKAFTYFDKVARKGEIKGYLEIANAYATGIGVEKSDKKAVKFSKLAERIRKKRREHNRRLERKWVQKYRIASPMRIPHLSARDATQLRLMHSSEIHASIEQYFSANYMQHPCNRAA